MSSSPPGIGKMPACAPMKSCRMTNATPPKLRAITIGLWRHPRAPRSSASRGLRANTLKLAADPGNDLVEHLIQRGRRLEAQDLARLAHVGHAALDVVLDRKSTRLNSSHITI